jgi:mannosyl-oligosaccharide glucosidase
MTITVVMVRRSLVHAQLILSFRWCQELTYAEIRHTCEQSDGLTSYSYTQHDGRTYAVEDLVDGKNNVKITVSWLKNEDGDEWAVRIEGDAIDQGTLITIPHLKCYQAHGTALPSRVSILYHFGLEGLGSLQLDNPVGNGVCCLADTLGKAWLIEQVTGLEGDISLTGATPQLGNFKLRIVDRKLASTQIDLGRALIPPDPHAESAALKMQRHAEAFDDLPGKTRFLGMPVPTGEIWKIKSGPVASLTSSTFADGAS